MKRGTTMSTKDTIQYLLNVAHQNPNRPKVKPGWEDEDSTHDMFMAAIDLAIAERKAMGLQ